MRSEKRTLRGRLYRKCIEGGVKEEYHKQTWVRATYPPGRDMSLVPTNPYTRTRVLPLLIISGSIYTSQNYEQNIRSTRVDRPSKGICLRPNRRNDLGIVGRVTDLLSTGTIYRQLNNYYI